MLTKNEPGWFIQTLELLDNQGVEVLPTRWQSQDVSDKPEMTPVELIGHTLRWRVPQTRGEAQREFAPNLPWAEDHFLERVSGEPLNPPPSEQWWPFRVQGNAAHKEGEIFSHTYPERFWPRFANIEGKMSDSERQSLVPHVGVRYEYGDLVDVVNLLTKDIFTRQAFLPIWFPEDTGAVQGQRVPCTLGYHFMFRPDGDKMRGLITYYMRSCDVLRHLKDDAYMAARLLQWVVGMLKENGIDVAPGVLLMHVSSLHIFKGDLPMVSRFLAQEEEEHYGYGV